MIERIKSAWRHHPWISTAFLLALVVAVVLFVRAIWVAVYWSGVDEVNPKLEPWMTPRYVIHTWDIKRRDLRQLVAGEEDDVDGLHDLTMGKIAILKGMEFDQFATQLESRMLAMQQDD